MNLLCLPEQWSKKAGGRKNSKEQGNGSEDLQQRLRKLQFRIALNYKKENPLRNHSTLPN